MTQQSPRDQTPSLEQQLMDVEGLRRLLRCSRRMAYRVAHEIGPIRVGRAIRLDPEAVRAWLRGES